MTDNQLNSWIAKGYFENVESLALDNCTQLTTDILPTLMKLPRLVELILPDLPQGSMPVKALPKLDNPFKVNFFYTSSQSTLKIASELYSGPTTWAAVFQIPMAREGIEDIFKPSQTILDPKAVTYWLYNNDDYKRLKPQQSIKMIGAESNAYLNDDNIVEFFQKFPEARTVSLYGSPKITAKGVMDLVKACPWIQTLNLTDCPKIKNELLSEENLKQLDRLNKVTISGTGISPECYSNFLKGIATALEEGKQPLAANTINFEETILKITDDQLIDENALETILETGNLSKIKRIDLEGCTKLTDDMLGRLLNRLNEPLWIQQPDGSKKDNPRRLNLASLNLSGCSNITEAAFDEKQEEKEGEEKKITTKHLGTLDCVANSRNKHKEGDRASLSASHLPRI